MTTVNDGVMRNQIQGIVQEQYKDCTVEQILIQIKRYESTATTWTEKPNRNWAQAINGREGYHYNVAWMSYRAAAENNTKAEVLKEMVQSKTASTKAHSFIGGIKAPTNLSVPAACAEN